MKNSNLENQIRAQCLTKAAAIRLYRKILSDIRKEKAENLKLELAGLALSIKSVHNLQEEDTDNE